MKIVRGSKRALPPLPQVAELINKLTETPTDDLADVLDEIDYWRWPRSDLNAWIRVLNKLDSVLEDIIRDYNVDQLQLTPFTPSTKRILCAILRFERLLLENSTNRKTFASYDRINSLLSTSDLDVLVHALTLLLRPAQQYSAQPAVSRALNISTPRLLSIAKRWSHLREYGVNVVDLVSDQGKAQVDNLPPEAREVQFTFYKTGRADPTKESASVSKDMDVDIEASEVPKTPVRRNTGTSAPTAPSTGAVQIHIEQATLEEKSTMEILADVLEQHELSGDDKYELMCRIRTAQALLPGREEAREKLVVARLTAIAIFVHTHTEQTTTSALFLYEPDLTPHIAELLALDSGVPIAVQTAGISALDAMARYRSRIQDVLGAVNAGVNHGTLMALLRKTVADVTHPECATPHTFVDALLAFVTFLASHAAGGTMVVGAGLVPLLIAIIENRLPARLPMVSKAMQLVDNVLYSFTNAFQLFCTNKGVDVLVGRIQWEIDEDIRLFGYEERSAGEAPRSYGLLPVVRSAALKHILRSMHRMMQSSGTAEGLRGLIDSSLLQSIQKVMEHRALFGPNVLPIAINIMATFVHNEPTSLAIIQEAHLPETFYRTIDAGLEPVIEVIQAIPNAIGALCLNQTGQDQLAARPTIIPGFFGIFTSERHQRVLQDKENAVLIGSAVDELVRHHPSLKSAVFDALRITLSKIEDLGRAYVPLDDIKAWYVLPRTQDMAPEARDDISMEVVEPVEPTSVPAPRQTQTGEDRDADESVNKNSHENVVVAILDTICRFLEGLFQHTPHCKDFLTNHGALAQIGRLTTLPCLPYDYANSVSSDALVQVVRSMFDAAPNATMGALCELVKASLAETRPIWGALGRGSGLLDLAADPDVRRANERWRALVCLHVRVMLLSDVYATVGFAHGRSAIGLLQILMGRGAPEVLPDLGALHRAFVWENVKIKARANAVAAVKASDDTSSTTDATTTAAVSAPDLRAPALNMDSIVADADGPSASASATPVAPEPNGEGVLAGVATGSVSPDPLMVLAQVTEAVAGRDAADEEDDAQRALRHMAVSIPNALAPFFQSIVKLFSTRRHPDQTQKQSIKEASGKLSEVLLKHLEPVEIDDRLAMLQYYTALLGLVTTFLIEERSNGWTMHTVLINTFYQAGGMDALIEVGHRFLTVVEELVPLAPETRTETQNQELGTAYGGLKIMLHLLHPFVQTKPLFESPQTSLLLDREKKDGDPGFFEPHNFLVCMRLAVLPFVHALWGAEWLARAPAGLVKSVLNVVLEVVNGEGEEGAVAPAAQELSAGPGGAASLFRTVPDEARITQITDMGFPRWAAERALARTHNNVNAATELLLANPFRFHPGAAPPEEPAAATVEPAAGADAPADLQDNAMDDDDDEGAEGESNADAEVTPVDAAPSAEAVPAEPTPVVVTPVEVAPVEATPTDTTSPDATPEEPKQSVKTSEQWRAELNTARAPLKAEIGSLALRLVDEHPSLVFDVTSAFVGQADGYQKESIRLLVRDIKTFGVHAIDSKEQQLAVRCHLLAIVLSDAPNSFAFVIAGEEKEFMDGLLALVLSAPINAEADHSTTPKWLAGILLVAESLLMLGEDPRPATTPEEGKPIEVPELFSGPAYPEARQRLFDFSMRLLGLPALARDDLFSALRLLVLLTRNHAVALELVRRDGIPLLFKSLRTSTGGLSGCQSYISSIIRHVVEDPTVLRTIMRQETQRFFTGPRSRVVDVTSYVRSCSAMALRDPCAFLDVTEAVARLDRPYASTYHVGLKEEVLVKIGKPSGKEPETPTVASAEGAEAPMAVDAPAQGSVSAPPEYLENLVHFLVSELIRIAKPVPAGETSAPAAAAAAAATAVGASSTGTTGTSTETPREESSTAPAAASTDVPKDPVLAALGVDFYYCGFIMQCLTELLFSYDVCKVAFLSYSPKKRPANVPREVAQASKFRTHALHFLLNDVISYGSLTPESGDLEGRRRMVLCNWAMSLTVALCVDTTFPAESKEVLPELTHVRKFVFEAISRTIKEFAPGEPLGARYGRLLALSELCWRLLTVRHAMSRGKPTDEPPTHIAKVMLEKNFVSTLTTALAEVDLNFPNVRGLVQSVLKPLELLSKIAIKMSRASDKNKGQDSAKAVEDDYSDASSDETVSELNDAAREPTTDLYRNSALGMFGGEMADEYGDEDMDDEEDEDEEDVEMDFGEESDGTSEESDVGIEDEEGLEAEDSGDEDEEEWDDEDDEEQGHLVEEETEPVADVDEEPTEDDQDDEGAWEDLEGGDQIADIIEHADADEGDEEDDMGDMAIYGHEGEDDGGMGSDDELGAELGLLEAADAGNQEEVFRFDAALGDRLADIISTRPTGNNIVVTGGLPVPVMHDHADMEIFGRPRVGNPPADIVTHPLLLEAQNFNADARNHSRSSRRPRINTLGGALGQPQDLLAAIEEIIGGPAAQLFQNILARRGPGAVESIRLDVTPGALADLNRAGGLMPFTSRRSAVGVQYQSRPARPTEQQRPAEGREFDPLVTMQRWGEEVKVLHGKFSSDRFSKLGNHVTIRLLPAAIKRAEEAKQAAELQEQQRQVEAKAKEDAEAKEREEKEKEKAKAEAEAAAAALAAAAAAAAAAASPEVPMVENEEDVEMADSSVSAESSSAQDPAAVTSNAAAGGDESASSGPSTTTTSERVTVMINGNPVDITDTGIDPTFLEALPDDMREEVVNQHIRDQSTHIERPPDSQISAEFLDALPPEIRAEIIQQEQMERRRAEERNTPATGGRGAVSTDMDPASLLASLDPQLRQDVLMEQDEGFIRSLPSHMIAEAGIYREGAGRRAPSFPVPRFAAPGQPTTAAASAPRKATSSRDAIQLLDKSGIAVLVRLLFFPQIMKKSALFKVLVNLCENAKTRTELFNLLLNILQDGAADLASIDRSFAQMTFRNPKTPMQTPRAAGKQRAGPDFLGSLPVSQLPSEVVPDLIAQRCLEALSYIVTSNEHSSLFFLTEHELPAGLRRGPSKKGKGKEKATAHTQYPVVLLLNLLDRQSLLKTPSILESLVGLLDVVTRPLTGLKDAQKKTSEAIANDVPALGSSSAATLATASVPTVVASSGDPTVFSEAPAQGSEHPLEASKDASKDDNKTVEEKILLANPPQIPHPVLRLIVNILTVGECGAKPFHHSLSLIQHLSYIPDAREVIAQELRAKAQELGQSLYADLDELAKALGSNDADVMASSVASKFSSPSSDQAKLLRVLKTIDYMYSPKPITESQSPADIEKIQAIYEKFQFNPLWRKLGECLSAIEQRPEVEHIATVLLPLIESLMVVCKYVGPATSASAMAARNLRSSASPISPTSARESMEELFVSFTDAHRKVLNAMVRNSPSLMSGSFSLLVNNPRVLDFDNKRNYFSQQLHRRPQQQHREHYGTLQLNVRRQRVFEDSFQYLQRKSGDQIKYGKLSVRFYDEEGVDAGGVTREWFQILARQMFDPNNALFEPCAADKLTYQPNKASWVNPEHLSFFKFVGRVIGKAIYDGRLLDAYFARSLYRQILGKPVDYRDVEWIDPDYYKSLCWILENDPTALDLTFSIEGDEFGVMKIVNLKENGNKIPVTLENRREFVQLSAQYRLYESIKDQLEALLGGFYEIIPKDLVSIFNEQELELLISGTPDIDVDEWRAATEYNGYTSSDPVIVWWWRALKSFTRDERAKLLSFATGTSRVPLNGFGDLQGVQGTQRFSIHRAYGEPDRLPQAHTCFNQIDLPQYTSYEMLRQQLLLAINEGGEGFGFA